MLGSEESGTAKEQIEEMILKRGGYIMDDYRSTLVSTNTCWNILLPVLFIRLLKIEHFVFLIPIVVHWSTSQH